MATYIGKLINKPRKRHIDMLYLIEKVLDQLQTLFNDHPQILLNHHKRRYSCTIKSTPIIAVPGL